MPLVLLLASGGCSREKSTSDLIADLKSSEERDRLIAVRTLTQRKADATEVVPALIEALKDRDGDIRVSAAIGLGSFGDQAREAIPALQATQKNGRDARVREAAGKALARIDPTLAPSQKSHK